MSQSWSVIIFCYNEVGSIAKVMEAAATFLSKIQCTESEIIIVDDGSTDGSRDIIKEAVKSYSNCVIVFHPHNLGIGMALRSGYERARFENITAVPADGQFNLEELIPYDSVPEKTFVSFFRKENTVYSLQRNILSYFNKKANDFFLGIQLKDVNWVKIYKRDEIKQLDLKMKSSLVESEICSKLLLRKNQVIETHSVYHQRKSGVSKGASFKIVVQALMELLKLFVVISLFRLKKSG